MIFKLKKSTLFFTAILIGLFIIKPTTAESFVPDRTYYENRGDIVWDVPTQQKYIALTFDDGPNITYTPEILDVLKDYNAKATFFLIGEKMVEHPELVTREVKEGHEIENHTFTHVRITRLPDKAFLKDVEKAEAEINRYQNDSLHLFRPPGGALNKQVIDSLIKANYEIVLWSWHQDTEDWKRPGANRIARKVINNAHNGDIVILHDSGGNRSQTVKALKTILPTLEKQGYKFVTVSDLLKSCPKYHFLFKNHVDLAPDYMSQ
ncbi:MAG TPA: polysaccharide deacetylase family protein [Candidatus Angelobacter sp.]|nr:polysaccharide deacetylase family protein [Candidatus Angelobacter sp.]